MTARRSPSPLQVLRTVGSAAGGLGLAAGLGAVAVVRRDKPLHAYGRVGTGTLTALGEGPASGVPLLDHPGRHRCTVRSSRAMSLAHHGPDVMGVALRIEGAADDGGPADLLLASTGTGALTRWLLTVHLHEAGGPLTTLLPQLGSRGAVWLRLDPAGRSAYDLSWSGTHDHWHRVGQLELDGPWGEDRPLRFAPVDRPLAGLRPPTWVRVLRRPAYQAAQDLTDPATRPTNRSHR
ncbi:MULTISPECIES: hypothetical protein [Arsenicicoccus]|uniref:hypothetical protein n=1 Tax=Arsenicicoccus TaxID=267408 RepID=UPI0004250A32|nr:MULTISPECIES: hypothetical protein [Arsenicicoccus]